LTIIRAMTSISELQLPLKFNAVLINKSKTKNYLSLFSTGDPQDIYSTIFVFNIQCLAWGSLRTQYWMLKLLKPDENNQTGSNVISNMQRWPNLFKCYVQHATLAVKEKRRPLYFLYIHYHVWGRVCEIIFNHNIECTCCWFLMRNMRYVKF
jgi:hypothetical protein